MIVAFIGAQSCGKTTQLNLFKQKYPEFGYVTEAARECPYLLNEKTGIYSQDWILRQQITREMAIPTYEVCISDRSTLDQLAYVMYAFDHGNMRYLDYSKLQKILTGWAPLVYDYLFYFPIEFPIELDGLRSADEEYRKEIDENVKYVLDKYAKDIPHSEVRGSIDERFKIIEDKLKELILHDDTLRFA